MSNSYEYAPKTKIEKSVDTIVKQAYINKILFPGKEKALRLSRVIAEVSKFNGKNPETIQQIREAFKKSQNKYKHQVLRAHKNKNLKAIQSKFDNMNLMNAYIYATHCGYFHLHAKDIDFFTTLLKIAATKAENTLAGQNH